MSTTTATPAMAMPATCPRGRGTGSAGPSAGSFLARRLAAMARKSSGRNVASPSSTSAEAATRTKLGTGSTHTSRPVLTTAIRSGEPRSSAAFAARTGIAPPPSATGTR